MRINWKLAAILGLAIALLPSPALANAISPALSTMLLHLLIGNYIIWPVSHATHLDGDFVVFELGDDRICILQPQEKKIAVITRGKNPIVVQPKL